MSERVLAALQENGHGRNGPTAQAVLVALEADRAAILEAYGLLEGASTYGHRQAIDAAMKVLLPIVTPFADEEVPK